METLFHASPFTSYVCWIKNQRSLFFSEARPRTLRLKAINCCRSAAFSASSRLFDLNGDVTQQAVQSFLNHSGTSGGG